MRVQEMGSHDLVVSLFSERTNISPEIMGGRFNADADIGHPISNMASHLSMRLRFMLVAFNRLSRHTHLFQQCTSAKPGPRPGFAINQTHTWLYKILNRPNPLRISGLHE